jgi:chromate transport protein ChrA
MKLPSPLAPFFWASSLHIGAAAATASLREELTKTERLTPQDVDAAYAISRVTPGTNLLALYAVLGHQLGGWRLALPAVAVGVLVPAAIVILAAFAYLQNRSPVVAEVMAAARAGGVAVFFGAAVRLLRPQLAASPWRGLAFAVMAFGVGFATSSSLFILLLIAGAAGAAWLRPR